MIFCKIIQEKRGKFHVFSQKTWSKNFCQFFCQGYFPLVHPRFDYKFHISCHTVFNLSFASIPTVATGTFCFAPQNNLKVVSLTCAQTIAPFTTYLFLLHLTLMLFLIETGINNLRRIYVVSVFPLSFVPGRLQRGGYYGAFLWLCLTEEERVASFYPAMEVASKRSDRGYFCCFCFPVSCIPYKVTFKTVLERELNLLLYNVF